MSSSAWIDRAKTIGPSLRQRPDETKRRWIGFDFSERNDPRRAKALVPLLLMVLVTALAIAALRIDLIRIRYAVAAATASENSLIEERRALIARKRHLRDPMVLAVEARERGFRPAAHVYSLPDPAAQDAALPSVSAGPEADERQ